MTRQRTSLLDGPDWRRVAEIGYRAALYETVENSTWAYRMWWMTSRWWWNEDTGSFAEEE
jgi:hypothetical protein